MEDNPSTKCFISYSWDSAEHLTWVRGLAEDLVKNGIEVSLDQWHLMAGHDVPEFMETSIRDSDFVLLVCTPSFKAKSNLRRGGVGYETTVVTGEIFAGIAEKEKGKFIPIIRVGTVSDALPSYLLSKMYIDFISDEKYAIALDKLLRRLLGHPEHVPPEKGHDPYRAIPADIHLDKLKQLSRNKDKAENIKTAGIKTAKVTTKSEESNGSDGSKAMITDDKLDAAISTGVLNRKYVQIFTDIQETTEKIASGFIDCLKQNQIDEKYFFWGSDETVAWLNLCSAARYKIYSQSVQLLESKMEEITSSLTKIYDGDFDLICLGIGDGRKEELFLSWLAENQNRISFYPVDFSSDMLLLTLSEFLRKEWSNQIRFTGILGDFRDLPRIQDIYKEPPRNLFTLLGNTLGNYPERVLLQTIVKIMDPGDFLIVDTELIPEGVENYEGAVEAAKNRILASYQSNAYKNFLGTALKKCGIILSGRTANANTTARIKEIDPKIEPGIWEVDMELKFTHPTIIKFHDYEDHREPGMTMSLGFSRKYSMGYLEKTFNGYGLSIKEKIVSPDKYYGLLIIVKE